MGSRKKRARAGAVSAGQALRDNDYLQRLFNDSELRDNLRTAYDSTRKAYLRISKSRGSAAKALESKRTQKDLKEAATSLHEAAESLRKGKVKKRRRGRKLLVVGVVGAGAALALSQGARKKALDLVFGAEEEFEYTSTTMPPPSGSDGGASASPAQSAATS